MSEITQNNTTYRKVERRNYLLVILNGIFVRISLAFVNTSTIIPAFLSHLTKSNLIIGIITGIDSVGWLLPQFFVASQIEHLPKKKWLYVVMTYIRISIFIIISFVVFTSENISTMMSLLIFTITFILLTISGGIAGIPFLTIISDTISPGKRGSIWSYRMFIGGALSAIAALFIKSILDYFSFPNNYGILFLLSTVFLFIGLSTFNFAVEPEIPQRDRPKSLLLYFLESGRLLNKDRDYKQMMKWRFFQIIWFMSLPFYTIFAMNKLYIEEVNIGFLFAAQTAGMILMNILWGYISDKFSNKKVLLYNSMISIAVPLLPFIAVYFKGISFIIMSVVFFSLGSILGGTWIGYINYVIELSPKEKVSTYLGFMNTYSGFIFILVPLGGLLADLFSISLIFILSALSGIMMLIVAFSLRETR